MFFCREGRDWHSVGWVGGVCSVCPWEGGSEGARAEGEAAAAAQFLTEEQI